MAHLLTMLELNFSKKLLKVHDVCFGVSKLFCNAVYLGHPECTLCQLYVLCRGRVITSSDKLHPYFSTNDTICNKFASDKT